MDGGAYLWHVPLLHGCKAVSAGDERACGEVRSGEYLDVAC